MKAAFKTFLVVCIAGLSLAHAADYPTRPIKIVPPFPPGGTTDIIARTMAAKLTASMGVAVVVENRVGGSGIVGTELVARSSPDGYTLLMGGSPHGINNSLRKNVPYDPVRSFSPISLIGTVPMVLVVPMALPVEDYASFVAYAKADPQALKCGVVEGAGNHLATVLFQKRSGIHLLLVPYKGDAPMMVDLSGGHINCLIGITTQVLPQLRDGRLRALGVTSVERLSILPGVPTFQELGMADFEAGSWNGVFAPAGTPKERVDELAAKLIQATKDPDVVEAFSRIGIQIKASSPAGLAEFLNSEITKWKKVIEEANIQAQ